MARQAGSDFGVVNGPRSKLFVLFRRPWRSPIHKVVGTTHELRLVALNCDRMVDKGATPCRSLLSSVAAPSLHCFIAVAPCSTIVTACLTPTYSTKREGELKSRFT